MKRHVNWVYDWLRNVCDILGRPPHRWATHLMGAIPPGGLLPEAHEPGARAHPGRWGACAAHVRALAQLRAPRAPRRKAGLVRWLAEDGVWCAQLRSAARCGRPPEPPGPGRHPTWCRWRQGPPQVALPLTLDFAVGRGEVNPPERPVSAQRSSKFCCWLPSYLVSSSGVRFA